MKNNDMAFPLDVNSSLMRKRRMRRNRIVIFLFLLPALLVYGFYNVYGIIRTFIYSTMKWSGISPQMDFIGLGNYEKLVKDVHVWHALGNNLILVAVSIVFQLSFGLMLAVIINSNIHGRKFLRTIYFMPMLLSTVATGILWVLMFDPYYGLVNQLLGVVGLESLQQAWLGQPNTAMGTVLFVVCWQFIPQYMILISAGMANISEDVYEAATIDGANKFQQFRSITLPLLAPTLRISAVLALVGSLKYFDLVYVMTGGGPDGVTDVLATYMYKKGFVESDLGYGSTIATFMFMVSLIMVVIFQVVTRKKEEN